MKGRISNPQGDVMIRTDVIAKYAGSMAVECFGIVGMASVSMKDGLVHLLKKDSITRGINVSLASIVTKPSGKYPLSTHSLYFVKACVTASLS